MFQHPNHRGAWRRRGIARNWKLIWKRNEGELRQSGKGSRLQANPGISESPKEVGPKKAYTKAYHNYITLQKMKDKERILKAAREKETVTYPGIPIRLLADFSKETFRQDRTGKKCLKVWKARAYIQDYPIQQSYHLEWKVRLSASQIRSS